METVPSEAYGTCVKWLPHVGRTGTLFPVVKTWMASIHPLYALDLASSDLLCDIPRNRIIALIHIYIYIYGYIPASKNSISGGRIWILPFAESIRELHALFPSMRPWYDVISLCAHACKPHWIYLSFFSSLRENPRITDGHIAVPVMLEMNSLLHCNQTPTKLE